VIQEALDVFHLVVEAEEAELPYSITRGSSDSCDEQPPPKKECRLATILKSSNDSGQQRLIPRHRAVREVRSYTDRACIDVEDDPLEWWCFECCNYPCWL